MKCVICKHGELAPGTITSTHHLNGTTLVLKAVPALVCDNCGEEYLDEATVDSVDALLQANAAAGNELVVAEYQVAGSRPPMRAG